MNFLDFLLIIIVGYSVVSGFMAGFARVGIGLGATVLGILFGLWFYGIPAAWIQEYVRSDSAANLLGFFAVFSVVVIAGGFVARLLSNVFKWVGLSWLDRLIGAGFGLARGVLLALAMVTVITAFAPSPPPRFIVDSKVLPYAGTAGKMLAAIAPRQLKQSYHESLTRLRRVWDRVNMPDPAKLSKETI